MYTAAPLVNKYGCWEGKSRTEKHLCQLQAANALKIITEDHLDYLSWISSPTSSTIGVKSISQPTQGHASSNPISNLTTFMVGSYSPHGDAGGTLHFPSPTHIHHVDPASAFRQLRRSLSRSPSKVPAFRLVTSKSASPSPSSPLSPSRDPLPNRSISASVLSPPRISSPSPLALPLSSNARKTRPTTRKLSPMGSNPSRSSSIQRSPRKRSLHESRSSGNAAPRSPAGSSDDQENKNTQTNIPTEDSMADVNFKPIAAAAQANLFAPARATARFEKGYGSWGAKSSPLKRSDGIMNLDQASAGSPSAKRRSLHGGIFSPDFNIFDHEAAFEGQDARMTDVGPPLDDGSLEQSSPMPKRTSSLRRTTLQQRHDKPLFARSKPNTDLALDFATPGQAAQKGRFRMSLDSALPSMPRDSPFSSQGSLPNASAHPMSQHGTKQNAPQNLMQQQRHPLSRTISQSTSNSSMAEDSPTHIPIRQPEHRRAFVDFSKSLPIAANRPGSREGGSSSQVSSGASFATPENYKLVKPLPAAFMSTGLISKRHKNVEDGQSGFGASKSTMPDTPCKRHSLAEISSPTAPAPEPLLKTHHIRHSFGTPSTPFNPHATCTSPGMFGKGVSIFGSSFGNGGLQRRDSFLSVDGDDQLRSPSGKGDSQSSVEFDIPPTPTKQVLASANKQPTPFGGSGMKQKYIGLGFGAPAGADSHSSQQEQNCKLLPFGTPLGSADEDRGGLMDRSPSIALKFRSFSSIPRSFTKSRLLRNSRSPTPLKSSSYSASAFLSRRPKAKPSPLSPASPLDDRYRHVSPHTPRDGMMPPDPSGLSISVHGDDPVRLLNDLTSSATLFPPATPTAPKDHFSSFSKSRSSVTPSHAPAPVEVDPVLTSRFDKVEMVGTGEFSQVYRVSRRQEVKNTRSYFSIPLARASPKTPMPDLIWAVKKSRHPYIGPKDRQRKLQEVNALKALGRADHTVQLFDSWEDNNHLYIQTEFCEEGSLDLFLDQVGRKARLDDFRIWKVMLEISLVSQLCTAIIHGRC